MGKRIVIMAGGTGGHVFPALAVAAYLREQGHEVSWMGTRKGLEAKVVAQAGFTIDWLTISGFRGKNWWGRIAAPVRLLVALYQARQILRRRKPQVVLGMGGFVAAPGGLMAYWLGVPLVIHEQNRVPGSTSRLLARYACRVLQAFPDAFAARYQAITTGNPLRDIFTAISPRSRLRDARPLRVLVLGGSQGARALNETVPAAFAQVVAAGQPLEILHQTGAAMRDVVCAAYQERGLNAAVEAFIQDMAITYDWADLAVCRAGAMTISELIATGVPAILIPYPYAIDDHQTQNAMFMVAAGGAVLLDQATLSAERLATLVLGLLESPEHLAQMSRAVQAVATPHATARVANLCLAAAMP